MGMEAARADSPVPAVRSLVAVIERRVEFIIAWLHETAPQVVEEQSHLDEGTEARAHWHYGYVTALRDVLGALAGDDDALH